MKTNNLTPSFRVLDASYELISALVPVVAAVGRNDRSCRPTAATTGTKAEISE